MKSGNWKDIAELIGIAAIVASLLFVGIQLQQDRRIALSDSLSNWSDRADTISELISDNAVVWNKACLGQQLTAEERTIASQILARLVAHKNFTWTIYRAGLAQTSDDSQAEQLAEMAWRYPGVRAMLQEMWAKREEMDAIRAGFDLEINRGNLTFRYQDFAQKILMILAELDKSNPAPDSVLSICGVP